MKKLFLLGLSMVLFTACQNKPERFTTTSTNIDEVKGIIADYNAGNWESWATHYSDTAKTYHNTWKTASTPQELQENLKGLTAATSSYGFLEGPFYYEQIIDDDGDTWVNFWGNWTGTLAANGQKLEVPVHLSCRMVNGKVAEEYGFYNLSEVMAALQEIEKANNMTVEDKAITAQVDKFIGEFLNKHDASVLGDILADNFVRYMNDVKDSSNPKELATNMNVFFTGFPDFHINLLHRSPIFNNTQFLHWEMTGTNTGEFAGSAATGKKVKVFGLSRIHFNGSGKVDEENVFYNELDLMKQLGKTLN